MYSENIYVYVYVKKEFNKDLSYEDYYKWLKYNL